MTAAGQVPGPLTHQPCRGFVPLCGSAQNI